MPRPCAHRVLIVENEAHVVDSLSLFFTAMGYVVKMAHRVADAAVLCDKFNPDVALVDVCMPHQDGYDLARYIREKRREAVLIVAMTAKGFHPDREKSHLAGIDHHFMKTADLDLLFSFVAHRRPAPSRMRLV